MLIGPSRPRDGPENPDSKPDVKSGRGPVPWFRFGRRVLPAWICRFLSCSALCILHGSSCLSSLSCDRSSRRLMLPFVVPCPPPLRSSCPLPTAEAARSRPRNCPVTRLTRSPAPWHASCAPEGNAVTLFNDVTPSVPRIDGCVVLAQVLRRASGTARSLGQSRAGDACPDHHRT